MEKNEYKKIVIDGLSLVFGVFLYALCFNIFLNPNSLVVSGFSGAAIVFEKLFGWNSSIFLLVVNTALLIVSFFALGWSTTKRNILGSILLPYMLVVTGPIATVLSKYLISDDFYLVLLFAIISYGVSNGLIYRSGFATGGSDIIMQIINKFCKVSESKAMLIANSVMIILGMIVFGIDKGVYSFIILVCATYFVDKLMFGISDSKLFYIYTKKVKDIKKIIMEELQTGCTVIPSKGGYTDKKSDLIMCVVANNDYYLFKQKILEKDKDAFIIIDKCYEVNGGVKRKNLPFL